MSHRTIDSTTLSAILNEPSHTPTQKPNSVDGPLKYHDQELHCAERGCTSPTHYKVSGIPRCTVHALIELNDMIVEFATLGIRNFCEVTQGPVCYYE